MEELSVFYAHLIRIYYSCANLTAQAIKLDVGVLDTLKEEQVLTVLLANVPADRKMYGV